MLDFCDLREDDECWEHVDDDGDDEFSISDEEDEDESMMDEDGTDRVNAIAGQCMMFGLLALTTGVMCVCWAEICLGRLNELTA